MGDRSLPYTVEKDEEGIYVVEGPRIEKMLGYTNLDSEKGFEFLPEILKAVRNPCRALKRREFRKAIRSACTDSYLTTINNASELLRVSV